MNKIKLFASFILLFISLTSTAHQPCPGGQGRVALCNGGYYGCANKTILKCNGIMISCICPPNKTQ